MKKFIPIAALLVAGTAFAADETTLPTITHDGGEISVTEKSYAFYTAEIKTGEEYSNVKITYSLSSGSVSVDNYGTVSGLTTQGTASFNNYGTLSGEVILNDKMYLYLNEGEILNDTTFTLNGKYSHPMLYFRKNPIWKLSASDLGSDFARITGTENGTQTGILNIYTSTTLTLSFTDVIEAGTFWLFDPTGVELKEDSYLGNFKEILVADAAGIVSDKYTASLDTTTGKISITAVPEPSAFGLLAGLATLALVATRRRK